MYYPYLRGRQFELIALRELVQQDLLEDKVIPIIEPIKPTSTLLTTIQRFVEKEKRLFFIMNPQVGWFLKELEILKDQSLKEELQRLLREQLIHPMYILNSDNIQNLKEQIANDDLGIEDTALFIEKGPSLNDLVRSVGSTRQPNLYFVPDHLDFRRKLTGDKILVSDHFPAEKRNADYLVKPSQSFSSDHLYYKVDNYSGFCDYSIVGNHFMESGFAPYAVVIHIVYFDESRELRIKHFTSESNQDFRNPAQKFSQALNKLITWMDSGGYNNSHALQIFKKHHDEGTYPGLGVVKQLSIMHHLEIMGEFLQQEV